jgi:hypothetical protein
MFVHNPKWEFRASDGGADEIPFAINRILHPTSHQRSVSRLTNAVSDQLG